MQLEWVSAAVDYGVIGLLALLSVVVVVERMFVDIMLVLLTVVLTTANFIATGRIPVSLPQTTHAETGPQKNKTIELAVGGAIYFDGEQVTKDTLAEKAGGLPPETPFLIRADRTIQFQQFVDVTDVLKQLKFTKVAVQTQNTAK